MSGLAPVQDLDQLLEQVHPNLRTAIGTRVHFPIHAVLVAPHQLRHAIAADGAWAVREEIQRFASWAPEKRVRIIVSSRLAGYTPLGRAFRDYTLKPFQTAGEAIPFLRSWLAGFQRAQSAQLLDAQAQGLYAQMEAQPGLRRVLDNPLLLRLAAQVFARDGQIARNREDLYRLYTEDLWSRAVEQRGADRSLKEKVWKAAEQLAWDLKTQVTASLPAEMETVLHEMMGMVFRDSKRLAFSHMTLQDYFIALRLVRCWQADRVSVWMFLRPRLHTSHWLEPLLLLCASLDAEGARQLVGRVMKVGSFYERTLHRDILLAARMVGECSTIDASLRKRLAQELIHLLSGKGTIYTRSLVDAFGNMKPVEAVLDLMPILHHADWSKRSMGADALARIDAPEAVPLLLSMLHDQDANARQAAAQALGAMHALAAIPDLVKRLKDNDAQVRSAAISALDSLDASETAPDLLPMLWDADTDVRDAAGLALGKWNTVEAIPILLRQLRNEDAELRATAVFALGEWQAKNQAREFVPDIMLSLSDDDWYVRRTAVLALGEIGSREAIPALIATLDDEDEEVRWWALGALGELRVAEAWPRLVQMLKKGDRPDPVGVPPSDLPRPDGIVRELLAMCQSDDATIRESAANVLGWTDADEACSTLAQMLADYNANVRKAAAEALGDLRPVQAIRDLAVVLEDADESVSQAAAAALVNTIAQSPIPAERSEVYKQMEWLRRSAALDTRGFLKSKIAERFDVLEMQISPYQDPCARHGPPSGLKALRLALAVLWLALLLVFFVILSVLYGTAQDILKRLLGPLFLGWLLANPKAAIAAFVLVGVLITLVTWGVEKQRRVLGTDK